MVAAAETRPIGPDGHEMSETRFGRIDHCIKEFKLERSREDFILISNSLIKIKNDVHTYLADPATKLAAKPDYPYKLDKLIKGITNLTAYTTITDGVAAYKGGGGGDLIHAEKAYVEFFTGPVEFILKQTDFLKRFVEGTSDETYTEDAESGDGIVLKIKDIPHGSRDHDIEHHYTHSIFI
jgi:hypothetical protein